MNFLKTVFWVLVAVIVALFARANWIPVPLRLWGDVEADVKAPVLLLIAFLIGLLPTWLIMRTRLWALRRRLEAIERDRVATLPSGVADETESAA
jgi:lipopolysaccharide assembly protein A